MSALEAKKARVAALSCAIELAGGLIDFSHVLGVPHSEVYGWLTEGAVPFEFAVEIEWLCGVLTIDLVEPKVAETVGRWAEISLLKWKKARGPSLVKPTRAWSSTSEVGVGA